MIHTSDSKGYCIQTSDSKVNCKKKKKNYIYLFLFCYDKGKAIK